jgi:hypothetical protein
MLWFSVWGSLAETFYIIMLKCERVFWNACMTKGSLKVERKFYFDFFKNIHIILSSSITYLIKISYFHKAEKWFLWSENRKSVGFDIFHEYSIIFFQKSDACREATIRLGSGMLCFGHSGALEEWSSVNLNYIAINIMLVQIMNLWKQKYYVWNFS